MIFRLSCGQPYDAPEGRAFLESWDKQAANALPTMDHAHEDDKAQTIPTARAFRPAAGFPLVSAAAG